VGNEHFINFNIKMNDSNHSSVAKINVVHSFPHRLGMKRICTTAWEEINSTSKAGAKIRVYCGDIVKKFDGEVEVRRTLSVGSLRLPAKAVGTSNICWAHDYIVSKQLMKLKTQIDAIHTWPLSSVNTIKTAKKLGIPVAIERCNSHTRSAYRIVQEECDRIGIKLPKNYEHSYNERVLRTEEIEYESADYILCPSNYVVDTFIENGFSKCKLMRFTYGVDTDKFYPECGSNQIKSGLKVLFAGICAVRKGLHIALDAWINSSASKNGKFIIAGEFLNDYKILLEKQLSHKSIEIIGERSDLPGIMRKCDVLLLPSFEEGFGLVCTEAMASGCVPLVSQACTELCISGHNSFVHPVGDTNLLSTQLSFLDNDRSLLQELKRNCVFSRKDISWKRAGEALVKCYKDMKS
jgi:glycosyltransferase involved in cell wall biosynthesis